MKRLIPFDATTAAHHTSFDDYGTGGNQTPVSAESAHGEPASQQCRLPLDPDPRRTAFYAFVSGSDDGLLYVRETSIEIVPFRDTEMVHLSYFPPGNREEEILVTVTDETCFDVVRPYEIIRPNTAIIVVGLDLGVAVEAEIIAGAEAEARYRQLLIRHQKSRHWYRRHDNQHRSGGV